MDGPERYADFYNGQTIDNREREMQWLPVFELPNAVSYTHLIAWRNTERGR